eukprot:TRINITY_DN3334_c0_g1_i1.p1 TRINITY_DN3334_c0_g1~~TRINITY_DN3334_c0_g1_i1.p1  ORF type:complete len:1152 (+),score=371.99 TRINITY_DN3334_c0_g1_i1:154-3609(+)
MSFYGMDEADRPKKPSNSSVNPTPSSGFSPFPNNQQNENTHKNLYMSVEQATPNQNQGRSVQRVGSNEVQNASWATASATQKNADNSGNDTNNNNNSTGAAASSAPPKSANASRYLSKKVSEGRFLSFMFSKKDKDKDDVKNKSSSSLLEHKKGSSRDLILDEKKKALVASVHRAYSEESKGDHSESYISRVIESAKASKTLDLRLTSITKVPVEVFELSTLVELDLSRNKITEISSAIKNLNSLRNLDLSHNLLTSIPNEITGLKSLVYLDVSFNPLPPDVKLAHWKGALKDFLKAKKKEEEASSADKKGGVSPVVSFDWDKIKPNPLFPVSVTSFSFSTRMEPAKPSNKSIGKMKLWEDSWTELKIGDRIKSETKMREKPSDSLENSQQLPADSIQDGNPKTHNLEGTKEDVLTVRGVLLNKIEKNQWIESLVAINEKEDENVNKVVAILRYNPKKIKFVKQEPNWAPKWAILSASASEEPHVVIMQRGSGSNLRDWILTQKFDANAKPEATLLKSMEYALDIAKGMKYLHSQNPPVIHHNLNSSNVLISKEKSIKITDFFLGNRMLKEFSDDILSEWAIPDKKAGKSSATGQTKMDEKQRAASVPYWMAPEVLENVEYDKEIDVYSFGMILIELVIGDRPFRNFKTMKELCAAVCHKELSPELPPNTKPSIVDLIRNCLRKDPTQRPTFNDIVNGFSTIQIQLNLTDQLASDFWAYAIKISDSITWKRFIFLFFKHFRVPAPLSDDRILLKALRETLTDSDDAVTLESFSNLCQWYGPFEGVSTLRYIQKLNNEPWFWGNTSSFHAADALANKGPGAFIVRLSSEPGHFAISSNNEEGVMKHFKIKHSPGGRYFIGSSDYADMFSLVAGQAKKYNLKVPCPKNDLYSDSNSWATAEIAENGGSNKIVLSLKKLCFRDLYRNYHLYAVEDLQDKLPADLLEEYWTTVIDASTSDEGGRLVWKSCWLTQTRVPFDEFIGAICAQFGISLNESSHKYNCLKAITKDIASDSEKDDGMVSTETFSKLLEWFGPLDVNFVDKITQIIPEPWFHGNMSHQNAEKILMKSGQIGTFLIRFSSKNRGTFTLTTLGKNKTPVHYRVSYNRAEIKYKMGSRTYNSFFDLLKDSQRDLNLKQPCPGSKFHSLYKAVFQQ